MKIYNYNSQTGEYLNANIALKDPLEKGNFLIPANATNQKPMSAKKGFCRCFQNNKWTQVVDNRDAEKWLKGKKVVFNLGDEITADMTDSEFTDIELSDQAMQNQKKELTIQRNEKLSNIVIDNILCDDDSVKKMAAKHAFMNDGQQTKWIDISNQLVILSRSELCSIIERAFVDIENIYFKYRKLKDELAVAT